MPSSLHKRCAGVAAASKRVLYSITNSSSLRVVLGEQMTTPQSTSSLHKRCAGVAGEVTEEEARQRRPSWVTSSPPGPLVPRVPRLDIVGGFIGSLTRHRLKFARSSCFSAFYFALMVCLSWDSCVLFLLRVISYYVSSILFLLSSSMSYLFIILLNPYSFLFRFSMRYFFLLFFHICLTLIFMSYLLLFFIHIFLLSIIFLPFFGLSTFKNEPYCLFNSSFLPIISPTMKSRINHHLSYVTWDSGSSC